MSTLTIRFFLRVVVEEIKQSIHLIVFVPRKKKIRLVGFLAGLWTLNLIIISRASILRATWLWFRYVDDIVDGDRHQPVSIDDFLNSKKEFVKRLREMTDQEIMNLGGMDCLIAHAYLRCRREGLDVQPFISNILASIEFDYERTSRRELIRSRVEINHYFDDLDNSTIEATLGLIGEPNLKLAHLAGLNRATRIRYIVRDFLSEDFCGGILNIPQEDLDHYHIDIKELEKYTTIKALLSYQPFRTWFSDQVAELRQNLNEGLSTLKTVETKFRTRLTLRLGFVNPSKKALEKWQQLLQES